MPTNDPPRPHSESTSLRGRTGRSSGSLTQRLFDEFSQKISRGDWVTGDKLPTESEFVQHYDVSRTVVREAISKLQAANLVETRHGIGTFVLPQPPAGVLSAVELDASVDVLSVLELRISLETEAAALAAVRRQPQDLSAMREALQAFGASHDHGDDTVRHDLTFHLAIATATGNRYFAEVLGHFGTLLIPRTRIASINQPAYDPDYLLRVNREHDEIYNAIERQDADIARAAMRLHLTNSRERLRQAQLRSGETLATGRAS